MPRDGAVSEDAWLSAAELAEARLPGLPTSARGITELAARKGWNAPESEGTAWRQRQGRGGGIEYSRRVLPLPAQVALQVLVPAPPPLLPDNDGKASERSQLWAWFDRQPDTLKRKAVQRHEILMAIEGYVADGHTRTDALAHVALARNVGTSAIYDWQKMVVGMPRADWLPHLVPKHGGGRTQAELCPEAQQWLTSLVLRSGRKNFAADVRLLHERAQEKGWTLPSERTLRRIVDAIPRPVKILRQEGETALRRSVPALRRDHASFHALQALNGDGHKWDIRVFWPGEKKAHRLHMVAFQDVYSAKFVSWRFSRTFTWHDVRLAFGDVVETYGIPEHVWFDNGREFNAKQLTGGQKTRFRFKIREDEPLGLMTQLGVKVHPTKPYWGQSKPIERAFRDFSGDIARHPAFSKAYTGNDPLHKPHDYDDRNAVPVDQAVALINQRIAEHNARLGRRSPVCQGRSFDDVFAESYAANPVTKPTTEQKLLWLLAAEGVKVREDGRIVFYRNEYYAEWLDAHVGRKVTVRFDPLALHKPLQVYALDGRYLGAAPPWGTVGFDSLEAAQMKARLERERLKLARRQEDVMDLLSTEELARGQPAFVGAKPPEATVIRPFMPVVVGNNALAPRESPADAQAREDSVLSALFPRPHLVTDEE